MKKKNNVDIIGRIPAKAWTVLSLLAALLAWTLLSHGEVTARAFPPRGPFASLQSALRN